METRMRWLRSKRWTERVDLKKNAGLKTNNVISKSCILSIDRQPALPKKVTAVFTGSTHTAGLVS